MAEVLLHVYDVTNSQSEKTNNAIMALNKVMRDTFGLGGVFHGAVEVFGEEWSFGYCETGSGVFSCPPKKNPMYTFRETLSLGKTPLDQSSVRSFLMEMSHQWPGRSYDLLGKNCNHFCDEFCRRLSVNKIPAWVNRFANMGDSAVEVAGSTMTQLRQWKSDVNVAAKGAYQYVFGRTPQQSPTVSPEPAPQAAPPRSAPKEQAPFHRDEKEMAAMDSGPKDATKDRIPRDTAKFDGTT